ncbi:MAG TPA: hypothetical protein VE777_06735 [Gaiellales bacterium]|nr:hypothetical protein [Gaiellales bacterium]
MQPYRPDSYWLSDIGPLRSRQIAFARAAFESSEPDGAHVGWTDDGVPACVLLRNVPHRRNDARRLLAA